MAPVKILLMENTMQIQPQNELLYVFDLKGSTAGRETIGATKSSQILKDLNLLKMKKS